MQRIKTSLVVINLAAYIVVISAAPQKELNETTSIVHERKVDHSVDTKWVPFVPPAFLAHALPQPVVFSNAATHGEAGGLFAANNNTLIAIGGPASDNVAIASLNSTSFYFAKPINETTNVTSPDGTGTVGQGWAGITVTAEEHAQAHAVGELIHFINHGGSFATGAGQSTANGTTNNPGPSNGGGGHGWGSKVVPKDVDPSKLNVEANSVER